VPNPTPREIADYESQILDQKFELARLRKELQVQELKLSLLQEICQISSGTLGIEALLDSCLETVQRAMGAESAVVLLLDPKTNQLSSPVAKGRQADTLRAANLSFLLEIAAQVLRGGCPYFISEPALDPSGREQTLTPDGSLLCVPMKAGQKTAGVIALLNKLGDEPFTREDLDLLTTVASQMAVILENARLYGEMERRAKQLHTLMEVSTILNSTLQRKKVLQRAMESATRLMETEVSSLLLLDQETQELVFEVALGEKGEMVKQIRLKPGEGIAGWVAQTGEPVIVPDVSRDPRHYRHADEVSHFVTRNMICVPVKVKDRIVGVLQAINKLNDQPFTPEDLELFCGLANQVAISIENARLYEELEDTFLSTAEALAEAIEKRDPYTGGHTRRVREYCLAIAKYLPLTPQQRKNLNWAATLHDVGKIAVKDAILRKRGRLTEKELAAMREHPKVGAEIMAHIKQLREVVEAIRSHQERNDGGGYPDGLRDGEIPLVARIIAVADTFDAITTDRPYRRRRTEEEAVEEIRRCAGTQFDEEVTLAFLQAYRSGEISRTRKRYSP